MNCSGLRTIQKKLLIAACGLALPLVLSCSALSLAGSPSATATVPAPSAQATTAPTGTATAITTPTLGADWHNSHVAFASNRTGSFQIFLMKPDGSDLKQLTDSTGDNLAPAWSWDAKRILFASTRDGNSEIYIMDSDGSHQRNLTRDPHKDAMPVWLPGGKIAFVSDRKGRERIFTMNADGSDIRPFPQTSIDSTAQFYCLVPFQEGTLFLSVKEGGQRTTRLLDTTNGDIWTPQVLSGQPDRSCPLVSVLKNSGWTMFVTNRGGHDEIYGFEESAEKDEAFTQGSADSLGPSRSGDQGWIAYYSKATGNWDIYILQINGKHQWNITNDPADDIQPAWQPY